MSVSKYKFVSPGVFVNEIDNSQLPAATPAIGPVIIGRTERGPSMRPTAVNSFSEYIEIFGNPVPGGRGGDVWRDGNFTSPMYATYAAQAWLRNGQTATVVRLLGSEHANKSTGGEAGWGNYTRAADGGGAYGLFLIDSGSTVAQALTGTLAAVWYFPGGNGAVLLSGTMRSGLSGTTAASAVTASNATLIKSSADSYGFKAAIMTGSTVSSVVSFNFDPDSQGFIRKAFNTNPILTNTEVTDTSNQEKYWLGHTFVRSVNDTLNSSSAGTVYGMILGLDIDGTDFSKFKIASQAAKTGWTFSQDMRGATNDNFDARSSTYVTKLFQIHSLGDGEWVNKNIKVSIANIKAPQNTDVDAYGTFDVQLRRAYDSDNAVQIIEQYNNCNLNPNSPGYIARKIGDTYSSWDSVERRVRTYGDWPNISKHVRVEVNNEVAMGSTDPGLLPFGFYGPYRPIQFNILSSSTNLVAWTKTYGQVSALSSSSPTIHGDLRAGPVSGSESAFSGAYNYPAIALRPTSIDSLLSNDRAAYFGYDTRRSGSATRFDSSNFDISRIMPDNLTDSNSNVEISTVFTLDDLVISDRDTSDKKGSATYTSGSRAAGTSATALTGTYSSILEDHGFNKFTMAMWGGHDGLDVTELDPFANRNFGATEKVSYEFNTVRRAIDACANTEQVDFNLMVAPGVTNESLTDLMVSTCEARGDALAIIDLPDVYTGPQEGTANVTFADRLGVLDTVVSTFKTRKKNSSYGCTYYPWVQVKDSVNNAVLWVPPSVVALGTFASSDRVSDLWFAPAGFNRGGLSQGSAGITVTNITERLTSDQRDDLYAANINPIASFPNEGIVIFGQKTLNSTTSALNRINVRRLLIFLKKEISRLANTVLFDNNVPATWARFQSLVRPLLETVKIRFGLTDYKLVLDETTTTPDLIDRNIMYAKIFLKPARAIEFIALDFIIMRTGAAFED